jgi:2-haloacid dehalogenase
LSPSAAARTLASRRRRPPDLVAAGVCGLRTAFVPRPTEHGPGQTSDLRPDHDVELVASDFIDLARQLGVGR